MNNEMNRALTEKEIALLNKVANLSDQVGRLVSEIESMQGTEQQAMVDMRWLAIGKTDLQKGFMSVMRSIQNTTTF